MAYDRWSEEDIETLRQRYTNTPMRVLEKELNRPRASIYAKAKHLNLAKSSVMGRKPAALRGDAAPEDGRRRMSWQERERLDKVIDRTLARMMKREGACPSTGQ